MCKACANSAQLGFVSRTYFSYFLGESMKVKNWGTSNSFHFNALPILFLFFFLLPEVFTSLFFVEQRFQYVTFKVMLKLRSLSNFSGLKLVKTLLCALAYIG